MGSTRTLGDKIAGPDPRRTGWAQALKVRFEVDPNTGMAIGWESEAGISLPLAGQAGRESGWRFKDMHRQGGQQDYYREGIHIKGFDGGNRKMGPLAVMEEEFKRLADESPKLWDKKRIDKERRKFSHKRSLQDMSTFLGTHPVSYTHLTLPTIYSV